jgi:hypothetical protein
MSASKTGSLSAVVIKHDKFCVIFFTVFCYECVHLETDARELVTRL